MSAVQMDSACMVRDGVSALLEEVSGIKQLQIPKLPMRIGSLVSLEISSQIRLCVLEKCRVHESLHRQCPLLAAGLHVKSA